MDAAAAMLDFARTELQKVWVGSPASKVDGMNVLNFEEYVVVICHVVIVFDSDA
jgi:hypothetical protein